MVTTPACKGKQNMSNHALIELGRCPHEVGGATYTYLEFGCPDCGVTAHQTVVFACGTRAKRVEPTVENCIALKWKADRAAEATQPATRFDRCTCGRVKLAHLPHCHECQLRLTGERRSMAVVA